MASLLTLFFETIESGAFLVAAPRGLEDLAAGSNLAAEATPGERLRDWPQQSRIANTTIVVIAISLTVATILWYGWWH
jgi:hypothetical protein